MEQLFDPDFLSKQYRRTGFAQQAPPLSTRRILKSDFQDPTRSSHTLVHDEDAALAETIMALVDHDPAHLARFSIARLRDTLIQHCELVDPFTTKLELQQFILRGMHESLSSRLPSLLLVSPHDALDVLPPSPSKSSKVPPFHEAALGVQVFLSLVRALLLENEPNNKADRQEFLADLIPHIQQLTPLSLAPTSSLLKNGSDSIALSIDAASSPCEIVDALQQFLLDVCVDDPDSSTVAMNALLRLAVARGAVSTFLLAVKVLLGATMITSTISLVCDHADAERTKVAEVLQAVDASLDENTKLSSRPSKLVLKPQSVLLNRGDDAHEEIVVLKKKPKPPPGSIQQHPVHPIPLKKNNTDSPKHNTAVQDMKTSVAARPVATRFQTIDICPVLSVLSAIKAQEASAIKDMPALDDDEEREVWSCGQNSYGELSHGDTNSRKSFDRVEALQGKTIVQVCAGNEHTVALAADGSVFTCGYNDNGQCGHGVTTRIASMTEVTKLDFEHAVSQIHAYNGCEHTVVVASDGSVASFGYNYRGQLGHGSTTSESIPKRIRGLDMHKVKFVSCSYYHTILSTTTTGGTSEVYSFGRNDFGQLGLNDALDRRLPTLVDALTNVQLTSLACGQYHSVVSTATGAVLSFGKNDYGQLGFESLDNQMVPVAVPGLDDTSLEVRCGYYHTIVLCTGGRVFGFGRNDYGQLGVGDVGLHTNQRIATPQLIDELDGKEIVRISCGCYHSIAVAESGLLYVFGRNNHGQLGTGDTTERLTPCAVDTFVGKRVAMVAAGFYHTVVLTGGKDEKEKAPTLNPSSDAGAGDGPLSPHAILLNSKYELGKKSKSHRKSLDPTVDDDDEPTSNNIEAAVCVLAHLDRLCRAYIPPRGSYPVLQHPTNCKSLVPRKKDDSVGCGSSYHAYCVDVTSTTFDALNHILDYFSDGAAMSDDCSVTHVYIVVAALRVVQANLTQLIRCGVGKSLVRGLRPVATTPPPDVVALNGQLKRMNGILVRWINGPKWIADDTMKTMIVDEAVEALLLGLELFYPCPSSQTHLIFSILKDQGTATSTVFTCAACQTHDVVVPKHRKVLLEPLLRRMADDNLLMQFLRHDPRNTANIKGLLSVLLDKISASTNDLLTKPKDSTAVFRPYIVLLNAVQKQVASWAGSTPTWTFDAPSPAAIFKIDEHHLDAIPLSWRCFVEYCMVVLEHATDNLKTVATSCATTLEKASTVLQTELAVLEASLVGAILPSLATTLLLFAQKPLFAITLLPFVNEVIRLIDGLNQLLPEAHESNQHILSSLPGTMDSVYQLPWLFTLEKLVVHLASEMAATLVVGDPLFASSTPASASSTFLRCHMFAGGFEASVFAQLGVVASGTSRAVQYTPFPSPASVVHPMATVSFPIVPPSLSFVSPTFPHLDLRSDSYVALCQWVRATHAARDASYRFLLKASRGVYDDVEHAVYRVLLKHGYMEADANLWAQSAHMVHGHHIPATLIRTPWSVVADCTRTMAQLKNTWQNQESNDAPDPVQFRQDVLDRCAFLLTIAASPTLTSVAPYDPVPWPEFVTAGMPRPADAPAFQLAFLERYPTSKWKRVRMLVHTVVRWRRILQQPPATAFARDISSFVLGVDVQVDAIRVELFQHCRRASVRAVGLDAFGDLIAYTKVSTMHATLFNRLGAVLRQGLHGRPLQGLDGVGPYYSGLVLASFSSMYAAIAHMLDGYDVVHVPLMLSALQCWSFTVEPDLYGLIDELAIVPTLHRLQEEGKGVSTVQGAVWAAFRYLVSSGSAHQASSDNAIVVPRQPQWRRVLDALHSTLQWSAAAIKTPPQQSPSLVLGTTRTFSALDRGVQAHVELAPAFSLRFWLYVSKKPEGRQMLCCVSSHPKEWIPYCCVAEGSDREVLLEVGLRQHSFQENVQRVVPSQQWVCVAVVYDGMTLHLYLNGQLDNAKAISSLQLVDQPTPAILNMGKPDVQLDSSCVVTGFDGLLAHVHFDTEALSPTQLAADFEVGPPNPAMDRCCYQLGIVSLLLAHSSEGLAELTSPKWLELCFSLFHTGTFRVQQLVVRLLKRVLPFVDPETIPTTCTPAPLIPYWIHTIGLCVVPSGATVPFETSSGTTAHHGHLAIELSHAVMHLASQPKWAATVHTALVDAMAAACRSPVDDNANTAKDPLQVAQGVGSFFVLGGFIESLRVGAVVELSQGKDLATLVTCHAPFTHVVPHKPTDATTPHCRTYQEWVSRVYTDGDPSEFGKAVRLNMEELAVSSRWPLSDKSWTLLLDMALAVLTDDATTLLQGFLRSSALKALVNGLHDARGDASQVDDIVGVLLALAVQNDHSSTFTPLAELEMKTTMARKRLYEVGGSDNDDDGETWTRAPELEESAAMPAVDDALASARLDDTAPPPMQEDEGDEDNDGDDDDDEEDEEDEEDDDDDDEGEQVRSEFVEELSLMGFPEDWCVMALKHTENDILSASAWIVDNLEYLNTLQAAKDKEDNTKEAAVFNDEEDDLLGGGGATPTSATTLVLLGDEIKETGRKVFGEMYFPFEEGGYLSNIPSLFMATKLGNQALTGVSPPPPSLETMQRFGSELNALGGSDLTTRSQQLERTLQINYARYGLALWLTSTHPRLHSDHERQILGFAKAILFRGALFQLDRPPEVVLAPVLDTLLASNVLGFGQLVWATIAHELTLACDKQYESVLWTQRDLACGDSSALPDPSVEFAAWLIECFFSTPTRLADYVAVAPPPTFGLLVAQLVPCLSSPNVALKLVVIGALTLLLRHHPSEDERRAVCSQHGLHVDTLLVVARRRQLRETSQNRLYFSPYLQGLLELIRVVPASPCTSWSLQLVCSTETSLTLAWPALGDDAYTLQQVDPISPVDDKVPAAVVVYRGSDRQCTLSNLAPQTTYTYVLQHGDDVATASFATKASDVKDTCPFAWDKKKCRSGSLAFADDGLGVGYTGNEAWRMVLGTECFVVGKHRWQIKIEKSSSAYLFLGVASRRANLESFLGADEHSWGFIGDGALYYQRNRVKTYGEPFGEGDVIGLELDCDQGTLSFTKNGQALGVAFDNVVGELCPAVAFYSRHQKVSLVATGFDCAVGLKLHGSPTESTVDEYLDVCAYMEAMIASSKLPVRLLHRAYDGYLQWWNETRCRVMTRAGYDLLFDVSDTTCVPLGFKAKDKVKTPRGNGVVVGVADGRLWVETEGETGAWFFHPSKIRLRGNAPAPTPPAIPTDASTADQPLSLAEFARLSDCDQWTLPHDAKLIALLNVEGGQQQRASPWNIGHAKVRDLVSTHKYAHVEAAVARVGILKQFNHILSRTIPFFDMSWHYFAPRHCLSNAPLLAATRVCVFAAFKHSVLDTLLEKTLTHPKKAEDDYDYPEDLPQVTVNRPKAAVAHFKKELETVVSQSIFGQAFDELHFLDNKVLRMVYSHPMDDGQLRTFKVKFEGEGADDYGGPYREFFAQFVAELQSIKQDALDCMLPFLMPSPNWRNGIGSHREKFVLNPTLLSPDSKWNKGAAHNPVDNTTLFLEMYHFLGQVLGIILRTRVLVRLDFCTSMWKRLVGSPVDMSDLLEVDVAAYGLLQQLQQLEPATAAATLEALDLNFTTHLSDGTLVELVPDGHAKAVTIDNVAEYVDTVLTTRLNEGQAAMEAMKQGLCTIVPANAVALFTYDELETRMCGRADVDVTLLQANTEYDEDISADDAFVQRFWRVLREMSQEDKCAFLRFVSARSRLPMDQHSFGQKFKIQAASGEGMSQNPDDCLPKSHTCFFALLLPKYSTDEICMKQFLYAIHNCLEMDGDFRLADTEMTGWSDINPNDAIRI
ncbi:Aste57867_1 [Aphanomyces stellatus]|uniref:Aste57867_1 protein n=1 Tax=Aphanomyces stellatus TaxID=120398 RepID=A0A485K4I2_9STRA|nr:hypothetical protein As57867_000001 [Aphanomyces stellatus]VFT77227.1 Aste57867_1 [Aphanomyces stellatus]